MPEPAHSRTEESPDSAEHAGMARYARVGPRARVAPRAVERSRSPSPVVARPRLDRLAPFSDATPLDTTEPPCISVKLGSACGFAFPPLGFT